MKRRRRHDRRKRILTERRENRLFFARGIFPASSVAVAMCPCGAAAFTRDPHDREFHAEFDARHAYCDEAAS